MTQEEKAKAYEEALERARNLYPGVHEHNKKMLEQIFPELRESEDEKVIKALETFINQPEIAEKITFEARIMWLSWLEKQKEPNEDVPLQPIIYTEQGEVLAEQKPAEWSEEDKKMLLSIVNAFRNGTVSTIGQEQWLKSLPERFNLQPKQEWSEVDEKMRDNIICILQKDITYTPPTRPNSCTGSGNAFYTHQTEIDWFEHIRPSWKPSEEQINALDKARRGKYCDPFERGSLDKLFVQLKKL